VYISSNTRSSKPDPGSAGDPGRAKTAVSAGGSAPANPEVTVVPGITRYHRRQCMLIRFLGDDDLERMPRDAAVAANCVPCKACTPDQDPE
jgi:hypothetical protein